ncbi:FAD-dependent oxidoreductase [Caenimonas terrae]|uniref:FAD-dependent oxidoreductase n=1 Tax=Caenimonas terrae TaxID=696074 RepID=A0ABW0N9I8_9BURK
MGQGDPVTLPSGPGPDALTRRALLMAAATPLLACSGAPEIPGGFNGIGHERGHLLRNRSGVAPPSTTRRTRVLIAGAGIAGLAAARALRLRGIDDVVLLELEDSAGGNSRGGMVGGIACPLGAHYLPLPGDDAPQVQNLLEELGLRRRVAGRWQYDERHLCHSPQERLFFEGRWQDGLLPLQGVGAGTLAQYRRLSQRVEDARKAARYSVPLADAPASAPQLALDAQTFDAWLQREQFTDPHLRWYLDYCCRDDYGAGLASVSAWAGIHYFASRHGFHVPGDGPDRDAVLTWPQGNAWLSERMAWPLGERLRTGRVVTRIESLRHEVEVDAVNVATGVAERWQAERCIVALPVFVAARVVESPPALLQQAAARIRHAPWVVANLHLREPLADRRGPAPAWDNVLYGTKGLGYVDARHQSLDPTPGPTVLSWYRPLGDEPGARQRLLDQPWTAWRDQMLAELSVPHPDMAAKASRVEVTRYGHAMAMPQPGTLRAWAGRAALRSDRLLFAHSDWSGYSVFEEAMAAGHEAGRRA